MAITKIKPIKSTPHLALNYIMMAEKTNEQLYISGVNCTPKTASLEFNITKDLAGKNDKILAYHVIQSFKRGEVTAAQSHDLGLKLAKDLLGENYEIVVSTHTDKKSIHNHIIFNSVSCSDYKKFNNTKKTYWHIRNASDKLCKEFALSVIENSSKGTGKHYSKTIEEKQPSYKETLKRNIDEAIKSASSIEDFFKTMEHEKFYEIKHGKHLSFKAQDQQKFTRTRSLGELYSLEGIEKRIQENAKTKTKGIPVIYKKRLSFETLLKFYNRKRMKVYTPSRRKKELNDMSEMLIFLSKNNINGLSNFKQSYEQSYFQYSNIKSELINAEKSFSSLKSTMRNIAIIKKYQSVYDEYQQTNFLTKKSFENTHPELQMYNYAKEELKKLGFDNEDKIKKFIASYQTQKVKLDELQKIYDFKKQNYEMFARINNKMIVNEKNSKINAKFTKENIEK